LFFYIFPLPNGEANVSIGGLSSDIQKYKIDLKKEVNHIISNHPKVKQRFIHAEQCGTWRGWGIPCHFGHLKLYGERYLLVGDAAGLANSFYKEGVGTGMMSGIIAANKIEQALKANDFTNAFLADYEKNLSEEFGKLLKYSRAMMHLTKRKNIIDFLVYFFKRKIETKVLRVIQKRTY
jgi:flavin-dependent dehydrogenase